MGSDDFTNTFAKELESLVTSSDLKLFCSAAALFYWDDNHKLGTRIEATQIMAEFADNVDFGRGAFFGVLCRALLQKIMPI